MAWGMDTDLCRTAPTSPTTGGAWARFSPNRATPTSFASDRSATIDGPRRTRRRSRPLPPAQRAALVIGERTTETAAIAAAFENADVMVRVAATKDEAREQLALHRWRWVMLDARWEEELLAPARAATETVRCFVIDPKRIYADRYVPLPLGAADVAELLGE